MKQTHPVISIIVILTYLILAGCGGDFTNHTGNSAVPASSSENSSGSSWENRTGTNENSSPIRIAMATDLHYQPEVSDAASSLIPQMKYISQLTDCLLDEATAWKPDILLLCGDLTNNGHRNEHEALIEKLKAAREQGLRIYVLPGNHDLKGISHEEFSVLYRDYGYDSPFMQDDNSLSYVLKITDQFWLLMLDTNLSGAGGGIGDETLTWVERVLTEARNAGADVITASHHNLLGHSSSQYNKQYSFENREGLLALFEKYQIPLNISGHLHKQHVAADTSHKQPFYEITGGMLADYPNLYSQFTITPDSGRISYQAAPLNVDDWARRTGYQNRTLLNFSAYSRACRQKNAEALVGGMLSTMDITGDDLSALTKFWTGISLEVSDGAIRDFRQQHLSSDEYRLWQQYRNGSRYSEWLDFLLNQKGAVDSHSLLIEYEPSEGITANNSQSAS